MAVDVKKTEKEYYQARTTPALVEVPEMLFLMQDGTGDPNTSGEYIQAVQALYGLAYAIRMKKDWPGYFEFVVPPLEGLWDFDDPAFRGRGQPIPDKSRFRWTMMIRQPDFVTTEVFEEARALLAAKKPELDLAGVRLEPFHEGLCVQVMHIGPYDDEPLTVAKLDRFTEEAGYEPDFGGMRRHHEIYLSDPRKTQPVRLKTLLRHPVRRRKSPGEGSGS